MLQRAEEPYPVGRLSINHFRAIHRHLFQDVYAWAGRFRTVRISKGGSMFCYPEHIRAETRRLFDQLKHRPPQGRGEVLFPADANRSAA